MTIFAIQNKKTNKKLRIFLFDYICTNIETIRLDLTIIFYAEY